MVNKKITKAFFKRNFELTTAEKKLLDDFTVVVQIDWLASIKPENSNIVACVHEQSVYEEVVIISVQTGDTCFDKDKQKIAELIQKYIPYHILLCIHNDNFLVLNTCDKRVNQNDATKRFMERQYFTEKISIKSPTERQKSFTNSLSFPALNKQNMKTIYDAYSARIIALQAAEVIGTFTIRHNERSKQDVQYLENIARLHSEISALQNQAINETQLNVRIQMNTAVQQIKKEIKKLEELIST